METARKTGKHTIVRRSRSQMFFKLGVLKKFAKFTRKHLCWSVFFNKVAVAGLGLATLIKKAL